MSNNKSKTNTSAVLYWLAESDLFTKLGFCPNVRFVWLYGLETVILCPPDPTSISAKPVFRKFNPHTTRYNRFMARRSKYRKDLADKIVELVGQSYCLRDVAYFCGLSERTISRWRDSHLDFNKAFVEATQRSAENIEAVKRLGHRTYTRKAYISPNYYDKPHTAALRGSQGYNIPTPRTWIGLPIRKRPTPYVITPPYLNAETATVEWIDEGAYGLILHSCSMAVWWHKHQPVAEVFVGEFI